MNKVWSREDMQAAAKALVDFGIQNLDMCSPKDILDRPEESSLWVKADRLLDLQCSLTASEKEFTEAVELIREYEEHRAGRRFFFPDFHYVTEFLKRQEGR